MKETRWDAQEVPGTVRICGVCCHPVYNRFFESLTAVHFSKNHHFAMSEVIHRLPLLVNPTYGSPIANFASCLVRNCYLRNSLCCLHRLHGSWRVTAASLTKIETTLRLSTRATSCLESCSLYCRSFAMCVVVLLLADCTQTNIGDA
jgi:hypothetical protein